MDDLNQRLEELARSPVLLVASDFDGTLSPIVDDPALARPNRESIVALHALASMPETHAAVISGRSLRDLAALSGLSEGVFLVGSHGSEFDPDFLRRMDPKLISLREEIRSSMARIADGIKGFQIEEKPASVAFHYRQAADHDAKHAVNLIMDGPAKMPGVYLKPGKMVMELSVVPTDKGHALAEIRHRVGASAALFIGDDQSDEDALAILCGPDVGVKVGSGETRAPYRVRDTLEAGRVLARLAELREKWLKGSEAVPIEKHSMLSDQRTVALLTPEGRIVWFCAPRIDSPALFAELIGGPTAGYFSIRPVNGSKAVSQKYVGDSFELRTEWSMFSVTDYMDCSGGRAYQRAGRTDLIRIIEGTGEIEIDFAPRLDFGRHATRLSKVDDGIQIEGSLTAVVLRAPGVDWELIEEGQHQRAHAKLVLDKNPLILELRVGVTTVQELVVRQQQRRDDTRKWWAGWLDHLQIPPIHSDLVRRSAMVLRGLSYGPTGAIAAAGTMGLPEHMGGVRNWDYRYCWLRDAALGATALCRLGSTGTGTRLIDWMLGILDRDDAEEWFRPVYTVTGHQLSPEAEIRELSGYGGSRPVRVGNAAANQLQLDVYGPIMELMASLADHGVAFSSEHWRLTEKMVTAVGARWNEPDHGIWEIRHNARNHVHSRVMCWMTVDRALTMAKAYSGRIPEEWVKLRDMIRQDVLENGWCDELKCFTGSYEHDAVDAASLHVGLSGLLPGSDPRFLSTIEAVNKQLRAGPTVYRYFYEDGLPGSEGGFHLCTAWLIESFVLAGKLDEARTLLDGFANLFGPTGLAPEEWCPKSKRSLGNHPQAYTHIGLINAAISISNAMNHGSA
ncbi:MAG TPA: trehalose-phosphatase [Phycisphaerales bacterium]|nr:trehalose-phosphatase [Phycisphaerales bacterium]